MPGSVLLGERGTPLCGGRRQRIAPARAVIENTPVAIPDEDGKDAPVVALGEATSAVADETGAAVRRTHDELLARYGLPTSLRRLRTGGPAA
ncbi:hypothetical protein [Streptomyces sp. NPDC058751]|uniref:hypothetical protein n=1 Tax=Streptomyces sp. NPDC058751 TaxID=3346623 RepID=UPI003689B3BF